MGCSTGWSLGYSSCLERLYLVWRVTISSGDISNGLRNGESRIEWVVVGGNPGTEEQRERRRERQEGKRRKKMLGDVYDSIWLKALGSCILLSS